MKYFSPIFCMSIKMVYGIEWMQTLNPFHTLGKGEKVAPGQSFNAVSFFPKAGTKAFMGNSERMQKARAKWTVKTIPFEGSRERVWMLWTL